MTNTFMHVQIYAVRECVCYVDKNPVLENRIILDLFVQNCHYHHKWACSSVG
jgi:hypothetical protein